MSVKGIPNAKGAKGPMDSIGGCLKLSVSAMPEPLPFRQAPRRLKIGALQL